MTKYTILSSWHGMTFHGPDITSILLGAYKAHELTGLFNRWKGKTFVLFEGGADVNPELYGQENRFSSYNPTRDIHERLIYNLALELSIPMLGICRGHQFLNVVRGGTLYQDLGREYKGSHPGSHEVVLIEYADRNKKFATLMASAPSARAQDLETGIVRVNSLHHQGLKELAPDTEVLARHHDGLVEACQWNNGMSVQWHPEFQGHLDFVPYMFENYVNAK